MQNTNNNYIDEDEIDLRELFRTIWKYKKFIVAFTLLVTILAGIYAFTRKPIYEIKADVQAGYISNSNSNIYLMEPYALKLFIINNFDNSDNPKKPLPKVSVQLIKRTNNILNLKIDDISNKSAINYLQTILDSAKKRGDIKLQSYLRNNKSRIKIFQEQKEKIEKQLSILYNKLKKTKEPFIYQALLTSLKGMNDKILNIRLQINRLKSKISPLNITRTTIIGHIKQYDHPVKPKKKLIIIVAFITGLILSIFLVFFIEFIKGMKEEERIK